jgi:hypothetical protein
MSSNLPAVSLPSSSPQAGHTPILAAVPLPTHFTLNSSHQQTEEQQLKSFSMAVEEVRLRRVVQLQPLLKLNHLLLLRAQIWLQTHRNQPLA